MTSEESQILSILDAVGRNSRVTQRELSELTGLNLAKINLLLRRMAERGQVKLRSASDHPNRLKYLYVLTPGGMAEKSRLTLRFAKKTITEYSQTVVALQDRLRRLRESGAERIVLVGEGEVTNLVLDAASHIDGLDVVAIVAPSSNEKQRCGIPITPSVNGLSYDWAVPCDDLAISAGKLLKQAKIPEEKLWLI